VHVQEFDVRIKCYDLSSSATTSTLHAAKLTDVHAFELRLLATLSQPIDNQYFACANITSVDNTSTNTTMSGSGSSTVSNDSSNNYLHSIAYTSNYDCSDHSRMVPANVLQILMTCTA
jgi:4-diphosphocytidyl-2C-methyl-D-erythritol kinase